MADNSDAIAEFVSITGARPEQAKQFLDLTNSNVQEAIDMYFQSQEESGGEDPNEIVDDEPREPSESYGGGYTAGGGRRLGGEGEPIPEPSASSIPANSRSKVQPKKKFSSLKDLQSDGHEGHAHGNDEDDRASDKEQEFYAGGDKSGLAVQDPSNSSSRDPIQRLMNTARRGGPRPPRSDGLEDQPARPSYFSGAGQTLGGDEAESRPVPAANAGRQRPVEMVERVLHLWEDGFSIDDGQLFRYDDPANRRILDMINSGSAPMDLMNVQDGQAVDVKLADHRGEKYVQPKKKYKPFEGSGQRLGSPTPGPAITTTTTPSTASNVQATPPSVEVNDSQPTVSIQVRLADGTRMPARFNTTHTIGDIYAFVDRAVPGGHGRPFVLATTFPTKDLTDKSQILGDMAEFKRVLSGKGGVGKSSVTVQLALSLCRAGHNVGVLDIDLTGPSIPRLFGIEKEKVRQAPGGWLPVEVHPAFELDEKVEEESDGQTKSLDNGHRNGGDTSPRRKIGALYCMSLGFLLQDRGDAVVWRGPKKTAMVGQLLSEVLWPKEVSHLLIDTPPGTSDEHISLMTNLLDSSKFPPQSSLINPQGLRRLGAVVVTTPQAVSTADVRKELTFCKKVGLRVLGLVENMAGYVCPCCGEVTNVFSKGGGQTMAQEWNVKFLSSVPLDGEGWGVLVETGRRPVYRQVANPNENEQAITNTDDTYDGRLVEKYSACSLAPIFASIVQQISDGEGTLPEYQTPVT